MEDRGGEEEGAAQGRTRPGRPGAGAAAPGARGTASAAGEGRAGAGARERGRHRRPPPATAAAAGEGKQRGEVCRRRGWWEESEGGPARTGKRRTRINPKHNNGGFSPGKKTLTGAEKKSVDCRRFRDPIDEPNVLRWSPRRDERSGTLGSRKRFTDWE
jgi:hypothetical protein